MEYDEYDVSTLRKRNMRNIPLAKPCGDKDIGQEYLR